MLKIQSEKGFSLVLVLFAVVLFSVIGLALFTINGSNAKQINMTQEQLVATDVAEMGIIYYESLFSEHSFKVLNNAIKQAEASINQTNKFKKEGEPSIPINKETINQYIDLGYINTNILPPSNIISLNTEILNDSEKNFKIISHQNLGFDTVNRSFSVIFESEGYTNLSNKANIQGDVTLDLDKYIKAYFDGIIKNQNTNFEMKTIPTIEPIESLKKLTQQCTSQNVQNLNNCVVKNNLISDNQASYNGLNGVIDGTLEIRNNNKISNSNLYIKNNLDIGQGFEFNNTILYTEGFADLGNSGLNNTTLYVNKGGTFGDINTGIIGSKVYSNSDFTFKNMNNPHIKDSEFIINGKLEVGNFNSNTENSDFYVNGNVDFGQFNQSFINSKIISTGNLSLGNVNSNISGSIFNIVGNITMGQINSGGSGPTLVNTKIYGQGSFTMGHLNSPMQNTTIIVTGNFNSNHFNQGIDDNTVICAGTFSGGIVDYRKNNPSKKIYDSTTNKDLFKPGGMCNLTPSSTSNIDPTVILDNIQVEYK